MLSEGLIMEVLLRLPVKSIIHCKRVCKRWRDIVSDPYFVKLHMSTSPECLLTNQYKDVANKFHGPGILKWVEQMEYVSSLDLTRFAPHATSTFCRLGSVNGLVSCADTKNDIIYILNPVLNEYMALPRPEKAKALLSYGFGVSSTGEYKVVRISDHTLGDGRISINSFETEVYTLGKDQWRSLGLTHFNFNLTKFLRTGLNSNSHMYWQLSDDQIYDFDLTTETFELSPFPPVHRGLSRMLGVVKGRISCIAWSLSGLEIWVMKEKSWYKEIVVQYNKKSFFKGGIWSPECVINGLKGSSNLLLYDNSNKQLVVYCLDKKEILPLDLHGYFLKTIPYHPTFLSLRNFGSARVHAM